MILDIVFWSALALLFFSHFGYQFLVFLVGLTRRSSNIRIVDVIYPSVDLLISAYNEEMVIEEKIENAMQIDYPVDKLNIYVVSESTDNTNLIVNKFYPRVQLIQFNERMGKSYSIFMAMKQMKSQVIVFSDANTMYKRNTLKELCKYFSFERVGAVVGNIKMEISNEDLIGESIYWKINLLFRKSFNKFNSLIPGVNGGLFAIRRNLYFPLSPFRSDDLELTAGVASKGYIVYFSEGAIATELATESYSQQFKRKVRIARGNIINSSLLAANAISSRAYALSFQLIISYLNRYFIPIWHILVIVTSILMANSVLGKFILIGYILAANFALLGFLFKQSKFRFFTYYFFMNCAAIYAICTITRSNFTWDKIRN